MTSPNSKQQMYDKESEQVLAALEGAQRSKDDPDVELARLLVRWGMDPGLTAELILRRLIEDANSD